MHTVYVKSNLNKANYFQPNYNIEQQNADTFVVEVEVPGFQLNELTITAKGNKLEVSGEKAPEASNKKYLVNRIVQRNFKRVFDLPNHAQVKSAKLEHGILAVTIERDVPEHLRPRTIEIETPNLLIEH